MKQTVKKEKYTEFEIELARRILCSTISVQMGISYQHCWKMYIEPNLKGREVGTMYLEYARLIWETIQKNQQAMFSGSVS